MAGATRLRGVNKPRGRGLVELGKVIRLLPYLGQSKKIKLMVNEEILDEMPPVRK